jgi:hypothetical protein
VSGHVTGRRAAGSDHQVVTVAVAGSAYRRRPCGDCPWRTDRAGLFPAEAFRLSANTAYDQSLHRFGCHETTPERSAACAGFLLRGAEDNLAIRMQVAAGLVNLREVGDGGHELWPSYAAMAVGNGVDPDDPALAGCMPRGGPVRQVDPMEGKGGDPRCSIAKTR